MFSYFTRQISVYLPSRQKLRKATAYEFFCIVLQKIHPIFAIAFKETTQVSLAESAYWTLLKEICISLGQLFFYKLLPLHRFIYAFLPSSGKTLTDFTGSFSEEMNIS